ncbi:MAG: replication protein, partial [Octadecabacter sp.]
RIPAALVPRGEPLADLYRKMVDENLVRKGVSFGEMAMLALSYARDEDIEPSDAVARLYASALKQKRRYILQFTTVLAALDGAVRYPEAIPRALGIELYKYFDADVGRAGQVAKMLLAQDDRDAGDEHRLLSAAIKNDTQEKTVPVARSKTSLRLIRPEGEVRVTAQEGRIDIRLPKALSTISREALQSGVEAFLAGLNERDEG